MFDEDELEGAGPGYLGLAQVPLLPLSRSKPISSTFQLKQVGLIEGRGLGIWD